MERCCSCGRRWLKSDIDVCAFWCLHWWLCVYSSCLVPPLSLCSDFYALGVFSLSRHICNSTKTRSYLRKSCFLSVMLIIFSCLLPVSSSHLAVADLPWWITYFCNSVDHIALHMFYYPLFCTKYVFDVLHKRLSFHFLCKNFGHVHNALTPWIYYE